MPSLVWAAALALLSAFLLNSQPPAPSGLPRAEEPFRVDVNMVQEPFRAEANLVEVDAVVHDSKRRYPSDLRREDFEIREDGKLQKITSFSYQELPRNVAIVVDNCPGWHDVGIENGLGKVLHEFIEEELKPADQLAIVPCREGSGALHGLSGDKELLHRAEVVPFIDAPQVWLPDSSNWLRTMGAESGAGSLVVARGKRSPFWFRGVALFEAIRSAVDGLSMLPGRKVLVVVSSPEWDLQDHDPVRIRELTERANRSRIVLYVLDPRAAGTAITVDSHDLPGSRGNAKALDPLAEASGGFAEHLGGRPVASGLEEDVALWRVHLLRIRAFLKEGLERVDRDSSGYYLMSYNPGALDAQRSGFHRIEVRTRRPGLTVRARRGYYARPETAPRAEPSTPEERLRAAVRSALQGAGLPFRMRLFDHAGEPDPRSGQRQPMVRAMLAIDPRELTLQEQPDGSRRAVVEVRAAAFMEEKTEAMATASATCSARAPDGELERSKLVCWLDLPLPAQGMHVVRAAVRDVASGRIGAAWAAGRYFYRSADEMTLSQMMVTLAPTAAGVPAGGMILTDGNPVDQVFAPGETVAYALEVYRPWPNRRKKSKLVAEVVLSSYVPLFPHFVVAHARPYAPGLFHQFTILSESGLLPIRMEEESATARVAGTLTLPSSLEPGEYHLLVAVYDLTVTSERDIKGMTRTPRKEERVPFPMAPGADWYFLYADAYITVAPAGGPAPARVHDPMGYARPLLEKYPDGVPAPPYN